MSNLKAKDILLTGASGAIGMATARRLVQKNYNLHLPIRNQQHLQSLIQNIDRQKVHVYDYPFELENRELCSKVVNDFFVSASTPFGLICNAGNYGVFGPFVKTNLKEWINAIETNFFSHVTMIHAFCQRVMEKNIQDARIIVLSGAGIGNNDDYSGITSYSTSKAAIIHLVEALASELMPLGIMINAIAPGAVRSGMTDQAFKAGSLAPRYAEAAKACIDNGGVSPDLTAEMIDYLLSDETKYLTGRLLSARFDLPKLRHELQKTIGNTSLYKLRRIDNELFKRVQNT